MAQKYDSVRELAALLREDGDKILDASSKLSISTTILHRINASFSRFFKQQNCQDGSFNVVNSGSDSVESFLDLQFVYDFFQKTIGLKIFPGPDMHVQQYPVDVNVFHNLKLLEIHRFSLGLVKGIKSLRTQLQYLTCMRSLSTLKEVLEWCGADRSQGFIWCELKEAVFSHNGLNNLDTSLEFTPCLQTLDLSHNQIQNAQPLNCLANLKYLNLSFNQLESVPAFSSNLCRKLEVLVLRNNYVEDIQEVSTLCKLRELDLSGNCLLEHSLLGPLNNLGSLQHLNLQGNPLSFNLHHREITVKYLHPNAASLHFVLDNVALKRAELRLAGSLHPPPAPLERSSSFNSTTTASTVIPADRNQAKKVTSKNDKLEDEAEVADTLGADLEKQTQTNEWLQENMLGMQDSGFVAGPRPASPSGCSIGEQKLFGLLCINPVNVSENKKLCCAVLGVG